MRVLYYTAGVTGSGHVVRGIALGLGLRRLDAKIEFCLISPSSTFGPLCDRMSIRHLELQLEDEQALDAEHFDQSRLFNAIATFRPDVLVVDMYWFALDAMMRALTCKKIFLSRQVHARFFAMELSDRKLSFDPSKWDLCIACEQWETAFPMKQIDPIILRNHDEILSRDEALKALSLSGKKSVAMLSLNAHPGDFEIAKKTYSYLEDEGWDLICTSNYHNGLFPSVDYFSAVDLLICGAGYNSFWESIYFKKETIYLPQKARFEDAWLRIETGQDYIFKENGADTLANLIVDII